MRFLSVVLSILAIPATASELKILSDLPAVQSLVTMVAGDRIETGIISVSSDPHHGALRPSEARALTKADVIIWIGPELSPWLERPVGELAQNARVVELSTVADTLRLPVASSLGEEVADHDHVDKHDSDHADEHHGHDDEAKENHNAHDHNAHDHDGDHDDEARHYDHRHSSSGIDPHLWLDPRNAAVWLTEIAKVLSQEDPEYSKQYEANAEAAASRLAEVELEIADKLTGFEPRYGIAHDSLGYFENRFGVSNVAAIADSDAATPGPRRVASARAAIEEMEATCILVEVYDEKRLPVDGLPKVRIDLTGTTLEAGAELYPTLLLGIADALVTCSTLKSP